MTERFNKEQLQNVNEFEIPQELLEAAFEELPPENVVTASNPSSIGMGRIITGIALSGITLNILALDHILPAIGAVLLVLGFRNLRSENAWFKLAYICSILRLVITVPQIILNATVYSGLLQGDVGRIALYSSCGIQMIMIFAFWRAINKVSEKAGIEDKPFNAGALFVWYSLIYVAVAIGFNGTITAIVMIIAFIMIIKNLVSISDLMATNGYLVTASPVKINDDVLKKLLFGIIILGIVIGYTFFSSYKMNWTPVDINTYSDHEIYEKLISLGYPKEQLNDLSLQELELLKDADCVVAEIDERPLNSGVEKTEHEGGGTQIYTEYPVKELKMIHVAVRIAGDGNNGELWRVIHHFALDDTLKVKGTENLQLWGMETMDGWNGTYDLSGRLLCNNKGIDVTADYKFIGKQSYLTTDFLGQQQSACNCMCDFSMPRKATDRRGYVAYTSEQIENGYLLNAWINYTHQSGFVQYPVKTANQFAQEGMHIRDYPFMLAQSALQFYIKDGQPYNGN